MHARSYKDIVISYFIDMHSDSITNRKNSKTIYTLHSSSATPQQRKKRVKCSVFFIYSFIFAIYMPSPILAFFRIWFASRIRIWNFQRKKMKLFVVGTLISLLCYGYNFFMPCLWLYPIHSCMSVCIKKNREKTQQH